LGCGSAAGVAIPPFFVFEGTRIKTNRIILRVIAQSTNPTEVCNLCPSSSSNIGSSPLSGAYLKKCSSIYLINTSVFDQPVKSIGNTKGKDREPKIREFLL
jgi:hypothetical protein